MREERDAIGERLWSATQAGRLGEVAQFAEDCAERVASLRKGKAGPLYRILAKKSADAAAEARALSALPCPLATPRIEPKDHAERVKVDTAHYAALAAELARQALLAKAAAEDEDGEAALESELAWQIGQAAAESGAG